MKCVDAVSQKKVEKRKLQEKESATSAAAENFESSTFTITTNMHTYLQPARKQGRLSKCKDDQYYAIMCENWAFFLPKISFFPV